MNRIVTKAIIWYSPYIVTVYEYPTYVQTITNCLY